MRNGSERRHGPRLFARVAVGVGLLSAAVLAAGAGTEASARVEDGVAAREARQGFTAQAADGAKVYATVCAACHQANGQGVPNMFPPVAGSEWVTGEPERLVKIILHGITGEIEVAGEVYSGMMPPWGGTLKDADVAAVSTYMRSAWGHKASAVTAAEVAKIRAANADRKTPWTAKDLALSSATRK